MLAGDLVKGAWYDVTYHRTPLKLTDISIEKPAVWGLTAAMLHYWTPTVRQAFLASYIKSDAPSPAFAAFGAATPAAAFGNRARDLTYRTLGTNVTWSPVKDLDLGSEVNYIHANVGNGLSQSFIATDPLARSVRNDSIWNTRIKIQRDF